MGHAQPSWSQASDSSLLARFQALEPLEAQARVAALFDALQAAHIKGLRNLHPAYDTLLVVYDPAMWTPWALVDKLESARQRAERGQRARRAVEIPLCCDPEFAPDLADLAAQAGGAGRATEMFTLAQYRVAFLGFAPGFPYLTGLPPELAMPRLARPRTHVAAGSVGIAGHQTGIYPAATPGGWRIIGRTPLRLFDAQRDPMSLLMPGDEVHFVAIARRRFEELSQW